MGEQTRRALACAIRDHEREVAELSQALAHVDAAQPAQKVRRQVVYLTAQMTKHRISMALLASRLDEAAPRLQ